jgi:hypothetical protein
MNNSTPHVEERCELLSLLLANPPLPRQEFGNPALGSKHRVERARRQPALFEKKRDHAVRRAGM